MQLIGPHSGLIWIDFCGFFQNKIVCASFLWGGSTNRASLWTTARRRASRRRDTSAASRRRAVGRKRTALCTTYCWTGRKYRLRRNSTGPHGTFRQTAGTCFIRKGSFRKYDVNIANKHWGCQFLLCHFILSIKSQSSWRNQRNKLICEVNLAQRWRNDELLEYRCVKHRAVVQRSAGKREVVLKIKALCRRYVMNKQSPALRTFKFARIDKHSVHILF